MMGKSVGGKRRPDKGERAEGMMDKGEGITDKGEGVLRGWEKVGGKCRQMIMNLAPNVRRGPRGDPSDEERERRREDGCINQVQGKVQEGEYRLI